MGTSSQFAIFILAAIRQSSGNGPLRLPRCQLILWMPVQSIFAILALLQLASLFPFFALLASVAHLVCRLQP